MNKAVRIMLDIETEMLENMIELLMKGRDIGGIEWQLERLQSLGLLRELNTRSVMKHRDEITAAIRETIEYNAFRRVTMVDQATKAAGKTLAGVLNPKADPAILAILDGWQRAAVDKAGRMYGEMLYKSGQIFQETVIKTTAKVALGVSGREAIAQTATEWAENGIPALVDSAGRQWSTEAYAQSIIRTVSTNVANDSQMERMAELGEDLVEISSHLGSRPDHADFQGRIFSISGRHPKYDALSVTGYGTASGIGGVNCRHVLYPYFEGTPKTFKPQPEKRNEEAYIASQKQRFLERQIRKAKREEQLAVKTGVDSAITQAKEKVRARQKAMRDFIDDTGRKRQRDREQVYGTL